MKSGARFAKMRTATVRALSFSAVAAFTLNPALAPVVAADYRVPSPVAADGQLNARFLSLGVKWLVLVLTAAMALDHLQIGGAVVDLAFGILFGGIVFTLSLAIGLGSRNLVSRSLESRVERAGDRSIETPSPSSDGGETIRHF